MHASYPNQEERARNTKRCNIVKKI